MKQFLILIPMISGSLYHFGQKSLKSAINPFLLFFITYGVGSLIMLTLYFISNHSFKIQIPSLDLTSINSIALITLGFIGIELGFLLVYRSGLPLSSSALIAGLGTSLILLLIGIFFYKEAINLKQTIGIILSVISMYLISK